VLLDRYTNIIRGIFSGHTHEDSFQVVKSHTSEDVTAVIHIQPAITSYRFSNPSFRVYEMDADTFTLLDYHQYRLLLEDANKSGKPEWKESYQFTKFFGVPNLDLNVFPTIVDKLNKDENLFKKFMYYFWLEGPRGPQFIVDNSIKKVQQWMTCRLVCRDLYEYNKCIGSNFLALEYLMGYGILSKVLDPKWEKAIYPKEQ